MHSISFLGSGLGRIRGRYEPSALLRFTLGKSLGFCRTMTLPSVPDLVLYRAIVGCFCSKAKRKQHQHVYFRRKLVFSSAWQSRVHPAQRDLPFPFSPSTG